MGRHSHRSSPTSTSPASRLELDAGVECPFGKVEVASPDDLREAAYEVFFTSCRSSPGFSGRLPLPHHPFSALEDGGDGSPTERNGLGVVADGCSKMKRALGLKESPKRSPSRVKRPLTMAELVRQQMRVSEQSDSRLRKTLTRTLVGQMGRHAETIILPLELLRQLKPSEFSTPTEYHLWQKQQLRIIEVGILLNPSVPLDRSDPRAVRLTEIIRATETAPIDTSMNSETMRALCNCVVTLAWRREDCSSSDSCHWVDGFPVSLHLYVLLLRSIFDLKDETVVLDEVDELIELIKKTWPTLGIDLLLHNVCFTWVLFEQFVATGHAEHDILSAALTMLTEVANDAKRADREFSYVKVLSSTLMMMLGWAEKQLCNYHESFHRGSSGMMESIFLLALSTKKILQEDASIIAGVLQEEAVDSTKNRVDYYIKSSMRNAFTKVLENGIANCMATEKDEDASKAIIQLAKETENLAMKEKEHFSCLLKRWHPTAAGVAAVTLHSCYGFLLQQYLEGVPSLTKDTASVLQTAGKLEKVLIQMVIEDCIELEEGGQEIIREMALYEVDSIIMRLEKAWVTERLKMANERLDTAKEMETWNPKSKTEPYAQSAEEMMKLVRETLDDFFDLPVKGIRDDLVKELVDGLETLLMDYTSFVASCGSKQSFLPSLPTLTRCNQDSRVLKFWKKTVLCRANSNSSNGNDLVEGDHPRPSTSRGTQRLFIRLNTLYYLVSYIHSLDKSLSLFPHSAVSPLTNSQCLSIMPPYFNLVLSSIHSTIQQVAEVAAFRLIFLDSHAFFYENLYVGKTTNARIQPALRILKQNLTLLAAIVTEKAQPIAVKEVMKASFEAFLMVLLAGGNSRAFTQSDSVMVDNDFGSLKRLFYMCGEGLVVEETIEKEAEVVQEVIALMGQSTTHLVLEFNTLACEVGETKPIKSARHKVPMPQSTRRWNRADPYTILSVLCHRNDSVANNFLKKAFRLPKRR